MADPTPATATLAATLHDLLVTAHTHTPIPPWVSCNSKYQVALLRLVEELRTHTKPGDVCTEPLKVWFVERWIHHATGAGWSYGQELDWSMRRLPYLIPYANMRARYRGHVELLLAYALACLAQERLAA